MPAEPGSDNSITVDGNVVSIVDLEIIDATLANMVDRADDPEALIRRVIEVGSRGVMSMGVGVDLGEVEHRIRQVTLESSTATELRVQEMLADAQAAVGEILDPTSQESVTAQTLDAFEAWRSDFFDGFDPERSSSHTGRLLKAMHELLGAGGQLDQRLAHALDPTAPGSQMAAITEVIEKRFGEMRDMLVTERARADEAERGTAKGFEFEDEVESSLRACARQMGALVERTSQDSGVLDRIVGDYVVELRNGSRVVIEAKNKRTLNLRGDGGILTELDSAMSNRDATIGICVSKVEGAFPLEVGPINVYGNRILVTDDGEGTLIWVALQWAEQLSSVPAAALDSFDAERARAGLDRLAQLAERFKTSRRQLTQIKDTAVSVHETLGDMRSELLEAAGDIGRAVFDGVTDDKVVQLDRDLRTEKLG